jgi:hypothetical protein
MEQQAQGCFVSGAPGIPSSGTTSPLFAEPTSARARQLRKGRHQTPFSQVQNKRRHFSAAGQGVLVEVEPRQKCRR